MKTKDSLAWISPESNRGYVSQGRERVTQATSAEEIELLRASAPGSFLFLSFCSIADSTLV